jgi:YihY family inner membrane protein
VNPAERALRHADALQQRHRPSALVFGVVKKYGDDNAGALTVQLTYSLFTTVFPLLLLLDTILALVLVNDPSARARVLHSAFSQFPVVGTNLSSNIHVMKRNSAFGLVIGLVGLLYGTTRLAGTGLFTMAQVWNIPGALRPNYWTRLARSLVFLGVLGVGLLVSTVLSTFGTFGKHDVWLGVGAEVVAAAVNVGLYLACYRVLTPKQVPTRRLVPGATFAGVVWTALQAFGGYIVGHYLRGDNAVYGIFGTVLGLLAWLYLGAQLTVYAAELNTVLAGRLWPRSIVQPPLTEADQRSISLQATENQRRPEQEVVSVVRGRPMTQDEYLEVGRLVDGDDIGTVQQAPDAPLNPGGDTATRGGDGSS